MDEYGPQTEEIKKFLENVRNLTPEQIKELGVIYDTACDAVSDDAYDAICDAVSDDAYDAICDAVWDTVRDTSQNAVHYVVLETAIALAVKDKISEEDFNALYAPWKFVMEK